MSGDICDWLAKEEANAEQWVGRVLGARFYREQFAAARNEIERLRAEVKGLTAERDRSCVTCLHGYVHPRYPIDEIGVRCERLSTVFWMPFHCSRWEARRER